MEFLLLVRSPTYLFGIMGAFGFWAEGKRKVPTSPMGTGVVAGANWTPGAHPAQSANANRTVGATPPLLMSLVRFVCLAELIPAVGDRDIPPRRYVHRDRKALVGCSF